MKPQRTASNLSPTDLNYLNELLNADRGLLDKKDFDEETPDSDLGRVDHWRDGRKIASYRDAV